MKKNLIKILKKQQLIISLSIVFSVILAVLIAPALVLRYNSWRDLVAINDQESQKLQTITNNVALLQGVDSDKLSEYTSLMEKMAPQEADKLRVISLINKVVTNSGMTLKSVKVSGAGDQAATTPAAASGVGTGSEEAQSTSSTTPTAPATPNIATTPGAGYKVNVSFEGFFPAALKVMGLLDDVKRTMSVNNVSLSKECTSPLVTVTVDLSLPLSAKTEVTPQDQVELTAQDIEALDELSDKATIDAKPTKLPTGRVNPFD